MSKNLTIEEIESKLQDKEKELEQRERIVSELEQIKDRLESDYNKKQSEVNKKEQDVLTQKTEDLKKINVDIEKQKSELEKIRKQIIVVRQKYAEEELKSQSELAQYKDRKLQIIESELTEKIKGDIEKIEANYQQFLQSSINTVNWSNDKLQKAFDAINNEFREMLEAQSKIIDQRIQDLQNAKKSYDESLKKVESVEKDKADIEIREKKLKIKESMFDRLLDEELQKKYADKLHEFELNKECLEQYKKKVKELTIENNNLIMKSASADYLEKTQLLADRENLKNQLEQYQKVYKDFTKEQYEVLKAKAKKYDSLIKENRNLSENIIKLQDQLYEINSEKEQVTSLKYQNEMLTTRIKAERAMLSQLQDDLENLSARIENKKSGIIASEAIETKVEAFAKLKKSDDSSIKEQEWLDSIIENCEKSGFKFSKRLYYSFHTSLKTSDMSPLTVLAGVSGTGKSKLPQLYSKFGGIYFLSIPVKPDWDSPQSLFGYYNSIEKRFDATTLLRALVMFQADKSISQTKEKIYNLSDRVLIVLLDEMNLAHIEQYFSDLLSKLEERRGETGNVCFEVDLGAGNEKYSIVLTDNVKWVGTMNEDETTKSLSDKVVDRGNIISFPRPTTFERYQSANNIIKPRNMILKSVWNNWIADKITLSDDEVNRYMQIVVEINNALKTVNRALGHRVWQSIENYMISHPLVIQNARNGEKRSIALNYAFEEALVHKVMPKLRGISTDGVEKEECLEKIANLLELYQLDIIADYQNAMNSVTGTFIWDSAMYLDDEYSKLKQVNTEK